MKVAQRLSVTAWVLTLFVWALVVSMRRFKMTLPEGIDLRFLPAVHAILNAVVAICLIVALLAIKRGKISLHRRMISMAMLSSILFLGCYVTYHITTDETRYGGQGLLRVTYLVLLISHIILAAASLPFILQTWIFGFTNQFDKHRRLARWVFPIWLYVAVSGPICYLMLRPYY